jgi:hypothetical protein
MLPICRFDLNDTQKAYEEWGFNCGPSALCAALGLTPSEIRPAMGDFESKHYTNPKLMRGVLKRMNVQYKDIDDWPSWGLVRIQWEGPWTQKGRPLAARQRHTHWVVSSQEPGRQRHIYDFNAMSVGGWTTYEEWASFLVPWLLKQCEPKSSGKWHTTHRFEIERKIGN